MLQARRLLVGLAQPELEIDGTVEQLKILGKTRGTGKATFKKKDHDYQHRTWKFVALLISQGEAICGCATAA